MSLLANIYAVIDAYCARVFKGRGNSIVGEPTHATLARVLIRPVTNEPIVEVSETGALVSSVSGAEIISAGGILNAVLGLPDRAAAGTGKQIFVAQRPDGLAGTGAAHDPLDASTAAGLASILTGAAAGSVIELAYSTAYSLPASATQTIAAAITINGNGSTLTIPTGSRLRFTARPFIKDLVVDGGVSGTLATTPGVATPLYFDNVGGILDGVAFQNVNTSAVGGVGTVQNLTLLNCRFNHVVEGLFVNSSDSSHLPSDISLVGCTLNDASFSGFRIYSEHGLNPVAGAPHLSKNLNLERLTISNVSTQGSGVEVWHGWDVVQASFCKVVRAGYGISFAACTNTKAHGNTIRACGIGLEWADGFHHSAVDNMLDDRDDEGANPYPSELLGASSSLAGQPFGMECFGNRYFLSNSASVGFHAENCDRVRLIGDMFYSSAGRSVYLKAPSSGGRDYEIASCLFAAHPRYAGTPYDRIAFDAGNGNFAGSYVHHCRFEGGATNQLISNGFTTGHTHSNQYIEFNTTDGSATGSGVIYDDPNGTVLSRLVRGNRCETGSTSAAAAFLAAYTKNLAPEEILGSLTTKNDVVFGSQFSGQAARRDWGIKREFSAYGDFGLFRSSTDGGGLDTLVLYGDGAGRIGLAGITNPAYALDVSGTVQATAFRGDGSALTSLYGLTLVTGQSVRKTTSGYEAFTAITGNASTLQFGTPTGGTGQDVTFNLGYGGNNTGSHVVRVDQGSKILEGTHQGNLPKIGFLNAAPSTQLASPDLGTLATTFGFASGTPTFTAANLTGPVKLPSYTVAGLPSAATCAQCMIYVSDGTSNKRLAVSDGTNWRFPDGAVVS